MVAGHKAAVSAAVAAVAAVAAIGAVLAPVARAAPRVVPAGAPDNGTWWGDAGTCHGPHEQDGCERCCLDWDGVPQPGVPSPSWIEYTWSGGNCSQCKVAGSMECADCFPNVRPWYNEEEFKGYPGKPPRPPLSQCKECSKCMLRVQQLYRMYIQVLDKANPDPPSGCNCSGADPAPPVGDCFPTFSCDCMCNYQQQLENYCKLDTDPASFIGPCKFDQMFNKTMGYQFDGQCDKDGYYDVVACGPVAPPPLPPNNPTESKAQHLLRQNSSKGFCWCVEPSLGIQNGSSATPGMDRSKPDCKPTVNCYVMGRDMCNTVGKKYCKFTKGQGPFPDKCNPLP